MAERAEPEVHGFAVAVLVLRAARQLGDAIQEGLARRGFEGVRPAYGFAFARVSAGDATVVDIAAHLGVTKQAASQLVEQLVRLGYVERTADPRDGRARLLRLTDRGWACTRAAQEAAAETVLAWERQLAPGGVAALRDALATVVVPGPLRPAW